MNKPDHAIRVEAMRIGGEKVTTKDVIEVRYPYTDEVIGTVPAGDANMPPAPSRSPRTISRN